MVSSTILLINSYFPTDPKTNNFNDAELCETLNIITNVLDNNNFSSVLFLSDINCDFSRNTRFTRKVQSFMQENSFIKAWDKFEIDFTHFQETNEIPMSLLSITSSGTVLLMPMLKKLEQFITVKTCPIILQFTVLLM